MKQLAQCNWCKQNSATINGDLCFGCYTVLEGKVLHTAFDDHAEECRYCRRPQSLCTFGAKLLAEAKALDGRMDKEYASVFGEHDPIVWFKLNSGEEK